MIIRLVSKDTLLNTYLVPGSLNLIDNINQRSNLSFSLKIPVSTGYIPSVGEQVQLIRNNDYDFGILGSGYEPYLIDDAGTLDDEVEQVVDHGYLTSRNSTPYLFTGTIDSVTKKFLDWGQGRRTYIVCDIQCSDLQQIMDRLICRDTFLNVKLYDLVYAMYEKYLAPENILLGQIDGSDDSGEITIPSAIFAYDTFTRTMDKIVDVTGFIFFIDPDRKFYFVRRDSEQAPWSLFESVNISNLTVTENREQYRNVQYVTDGTAITELQTDVFPSGNLDGNTLVLSYDLDSITPSGVLIDGDIVDIGVRGKDDDNEDIGVFYEIGSPNITVNWDTDKEIRVTYQGRYPILGYSTDQTQIDLRAAEETGTGKYENIESNKDLKTLDAITSYANAKIADYAKFGNKVSFQTMQEGLYPGAIIPVTLPKLGFTDTTNVLINSVQLSEYEKPNEFNYYVGATDMTQVGGWQKFFYNWIWKGNNVEIGNESENYILQESWIDYVPDNGLYTVFYQIAPSVDLAPNTVKAPTYDRVLIDGYYVPLDSTAYVDIVFSDGTPTYRQYLTDNQYHNLYYTGLGNLQDMTTVFNIFLNAANGAISSVKIYGGSSATKEVGTGKLIANHAFVHTKTKSELIQIVYKIQEQYH